MTTQVLHKELKNGSWWKHRTSMEHFLIIFLFILFVVMVALVISLSTFRAKGKVADTCTTFGCIQAAYQVMSYINKSADPCDNFYNFACGRFLSTTDIPEDDTDVSSFDLIEDKVVEKVKVLVQTHLLKNEPRAFKLAKKMYKACMNVTKIEAVGTQPLKDVLVDLGGWPVLMANNWNERDFDWKKTTYELRHLGFSDNSLVDIGINVDKKNSSRMMLEIDQANLGLSQKILLKGWKEPVVIAYYDLMVEVAVLLGADKSRATRELKDALEFEMKLANISIPSEERRNFTLEYNPMTVTELQEKFPSIPWLKSFNMLLAPIEKIVEDELVNVEVPKYLKAFEELIRKIPKRTIANYILWRAVFRSIPYLNEDMRRLQLKFLTVATGKTDKTPKWKTCVYFSSRLDIAVGSMYIRNYFDETSKQKVNEMVANIREQFTSSLKTTTWMDNVTRQRALEKIANMHVRMAYPDELLDSSKVDEFYKDLKVDQENFLKAFLSVNLFDVEEWIKRFRQPLNKTDWRTQSRVTNVNAYSRFDENAIEFPAGILQGLFFGYDRPHYMNYGALGSTIGHEIIHGFDDMGRQFDKDGNLVDWWEKFAEDEYLKRVRCFKDQYSTFYVSEVDMYVNSNNTVGEDIADNGGIRQSYRTYGRWVEKNGPELKLPGLDFTPKQLFWISAANAECGKTRTEQLKLRVLNNYHTPPEFRVLGPIRNAESFAKDFNCPVGSNMNPQRKCELW